MNKKFTHIDNILGWLCFASIFLPLIFLERNHNCEYSDNCFRIFYDGKLGICVEKAVNEVCLAIAVIWWIVIYGGALVISKNKNAISPYVVVALVFSVAVFLAFIDPSKLKFALSLIPSIILLVTAQIFDSRITKIKQQ